MNIPEVARGIMIGLEDHKWYENEARLIAALRNAYDAGERRATFTVPQADGDGRGGTVTEVGQG